MESFWGNPVMQRSKYCSFQIANAALSEMVLSDQWVIVSDFPISPDSYKNYTWTVQQGKQDATQKN